jgi:small nuclear ribonucleoprotein (snRNP)-like protein
LSCVVVFHASRPGTVRDRLRSRVVVTLKSGAAFDGVLYSADRGAWVLRNAHALGAGENDSNVPVDGEVLILASDIEFAQRP